MRSGVGDDDGDRFGPPPDPADRLWRHPSEAGQGALRTAPGRLGARQSLVVALTAALAGVATTTGLFFILGTGDPATIRVREQVAMAPVIAMAPTLVSDRDWAPTLADRVGDALLTIEVHTPTQTRRASAVAFSDDGHVLMPAHVVAGATEVVALIGGERRRASVVQTDAATDVAVVKILQAHTRPAVWAREYTPAIGDRVAVVRASPSAGPTATDTVILSIDNRVGGQMLFRIDAPIAEVDDGAVVVDGRGAVIGLATAITAGTRDGYAIPAALARATAVALIDKKQSERPWLGVEIVSALDGVRVTSVAPSGPAASSGLGADDVITAIDGKSMSSITAVATVLRERGIGTTVALSYLRGDEALRCSITIAAAPV